MLNISDDPTMAGTLIFYIKDGSIQVGKEPEKGIKMTGLGMKDVHCKI